MPMEWERAKNDVTYYTHDITGDPLPNDDLDIQVLWLLAMEEKGVDIDARVLCELRSIPHSLRASSLYTREALSFLQVAAGNCPFFQPTTSAIGSRDEIPGGGQG